MKSLLQHLVLSHLHISWMMQMSIGAFDSAGSHVDLYFWCFCSQCLGLWAAVTVYSDSWCPETGSVTSVLSNCKCFLKFNTSFWNIDGRVLLLSCCIDTSCSLLCGPDLSWFGCWNAFSFVTFQSLVVHYVAGSYSETFGHLCTNWLCCLISRWSSPG